MFKNILVAVAPEDIEGGQKIIAKAEALLDQGGTLRVVSVAEPIPAYLSAEMPVSLIEGQIAAVESTLASIKPPALAAGNYVTESRMGSPATELLAAAEEHGCDLIVVASHKPEFATYFIGSTAAKVVRHAQCSVLVVR